MYRVLKKNEYDYGSYELVPCRIEDIFLIMRWRNEQIDVLRQKAILTKLDQEMYYRNVIKPSFEEKNPKIILFSFLLNDHCIGYGGLTNIDWQSKHVELSFLLETKRAKNADTYSKDFSAYLELVKDIVFNDLKFHRIFTETYNIRPLHIEILEESGFLLEGRMKEHIIIDKEYVDSVIHGLVNHKGLE